MRRERRGIAVVGGRVVKMQKIRCALEHIGGQIAGLIVHPAGSEVERDFLSRRTHFDVGSPGTELEFAL